MDQNKIEAPVLYTIQEVVDRLKISRTTVYKMIKEKGIVPLQFGVSVRLTVDQINQLIEQEEKSTD